MYPLGSIVSVQQSGRVASYLALIVDQEAGKEFADAYPYFGYTPDAADASRYFLVRAIGDRAVEEGVPRRTAIPPSEPFRREYVRWAYVAMNSTKVVAQPGVESLDRFFSLFQLFRSMGLEDRGEEFELSVIRDHWAGVVKRPTEVSPEYAHFRAMLERIAPRSSVTSTEPSHEEGDAA